MRRSLLLVSLCAGLMGCPEGFWDTQGDSDEPLDPDGGSDMGTDTDPDTTPDPDPGTDLVEGDANELDIVLANQSTRDSFQLEINQAYTEDVQGYLTVHLDDNGSAGQLLGVERIPVRTRSARTINLDVELDVRQDIIVTLHLDEPRNSRWDGDEPVATDIDGNPLVLSYNLYLESTTTDESSPYYTSPCSLPRWWDDPTDMMVDCRCAPNVVAFPVCQSPSFVSADLTWGSGPRIETLPIDRRMLGAVIDEPRGEAIYTVSWQDENYSESGAVMAVDYTTGDRRIISGRWLDPNAGYFVTGDGPELNDPRDIEMGADGNYYVMALKDRQTSLNGTNIVRIDANTGDRTLVWGGRNPDFAQCDNGASPPGTQDVQIWKHAFTMDPSGNFYMATMRNGSPVSGRGILRISADGQTCEHVTMDGAATGNAYHPSIGGGYPAGQFNYEGLAWHDGYLWSTNNGDLIRVDPDNGNRLRVAGSGAAVNSGSVTGRYLQYNDHWDLLMITGVLGQPELVNGVDLSNGEVFTFAPCLEPAANNTFTTDCFEGSASPNGRSERAMVVLPTGQWMAGSGAGFALIEPETGNSHILSY